MSGRERRYDLVVLHQCSAAKSKMASTMKSESEMRCKRATYRTGGNAGSKQKHQRKGNIDVVVWCAGGLARRDIEGLG